MTKNIESDIPFHQEVVHCMHSHSAVECVVDCTTSNIRSAYVAIEVEVNGVSPQLKGLAGVCHLNVLNPSCDKMLILASSMEHDLRSKLVINYF